MAGRTAGGEPRHARVLFIEDDETGRELGRFNLSKRGYQVDVARDGKAGLELFGDGRHDVVVTDLKMPGTSGMEVLAEVRRRAPEVPVIVVTAYGNVERAVEAMKAGAHDFIGKPFDREHLVLAVRKALESRDLRREVRQLRIKASGVERPLLYASGAMARVVATAERLAASDATVLVTGESGTGKEIVARLIHVRSSRAEAPFVALSCAAVPSELIESELFGHEKGAFTGATRDRPGRFRRADGGTLFLDEVAELPIDLQGKLLRALQEKAVDVVGADAPVPVDVRVIAATNKDLAEQVAEGRFREDLYYRINVVELGIPPLRERREDIPVLVEHFVRLHGGERDLTVPREVMDELVGRSWPGNVRELENACERLAILASGSEVALADLPRRVDRSAPEGLGCPEAESAGEWPPLPAEGLSLVELERRVIERVLERTRWNVSEAARYLKVPRHILTYRMEKFGLRRPQ